MQDGQDMSLVFVFLDTRRCACGVRIRQSVVYYTGHVSVQLVLQWWGLAIAHPCSFSP